TTMTFDPDYSYLAYYDADGNHNMSDEWTISNITVKKIAIGYTVTATVNYNGSSSVISYSGAIDMIDSRAPASVFNQIKSNLNLTLDGAYAVYDGNLYNSNTGSMYINLYDHAFNPETGGMIEDGFSLALQVFGKLFSDSSNATLDPGTYTVARNFSRYSWYPGTEIQYMGMTGLMGCYAKERNSVKYSDNYGYSYLSEGTIVIENMGDEVFKITVDAVTTLGHSVKGTFQGKVPVVDQSDDSKGSSISTLEDDVVLDIAKIKQGHLWNNGIKNGNQLFILDIGSPSGRDTELDNGGDIIRMEFVVPSGEKHLLPGTYTVMEEKWDSMYTPFKLAKGRFEGTSSGGTDLTGTRYMHFIEGRNYIMDQYAPAYYGTVGVSKNADGTYKFNIALVCDAYFHIDGEWEGPIELMYDPATGLDDITSDNNGLGIEFVNNSTLRVTGAETLAGATLYTSTGIAIPCTIDGDCINISTLPYGVYILNVNGKTIKFIKR
ncbi:MAG: T9SS C-terminal target domain-containing protein, partial [Muribaculaceae bacterium]|nr:T9SS C-terminal target domain-containing protein [Muribaculaceae bacterium]